jgi:hypothetical protein
MPNFSHIWLDVCHLSFLYMAVYDVLSCWLPGRLWSIIHPLIAHISSAIGICCCVGSPAVCHHQRTTGRQASQLLRLEPPPAIAQPVRGWLTD